ncbi:MAG: efflux RND transporter periplasmic adaptor subunit [Gammaproteobacteria bacterium]|nr:efflux RND transporter periplasmic adaptor subunit [Gammaproteobacteria bacterium]
MQNSAFETPQPSRFKKFLKSLVFFLPLLALLGLLYSGNVQFGPGSDNQQSSQNDKNSDTSNKDRRRNGKNGDKQEKEIKIPVETNLPGTGTLYAYYSGTASLYAENKTEVAAKIGGQVVRILVEEGDIVKAGQELATIEADRYQLEMQRAEANLNKITQEITRKQELYEQKLIPRDSFESLRYDKQSAEAALALAKLDLSHTRIRAPISGIISSRMVQKGNTLGVNQSVYEITSLKSLQADLFVPERELSRIKIGQQAKVSFDALQTEDQTPIIASIKRISPVIDSKTGTFKTTLELDNSAGFFKPGMFGRFNVVFGEHANVMTLPRNAILELDSERSVFHIVDDKAKKIAIQTGYENNGVVEITSGLTGDEAVVILGQAGLRVGSKVNVVKGPNPRTPEYQAELDKLSKEKSDNEVQETASDTDGGDSNNAGG